MTIKEDAIDRLIELKREEKFAPVEDEYVGIIPLENQPLSNQILNDSIDEIIEILRSKPSQDRILEAYKRGLEKLEDVASDTEDREMVCSYYDRIRQIIGFDSTNGVLNQWLYW